MTCDFKHYCKSSTDDDELCSNSCRKSCPSLCKSNSDDGSHDIVPPPSQKHVISTNLIIMACVLGAAFLLGICWILILNFYAKWKSSRRVNSNAPHVLDHTHENFLDENHRPQVEHHIWYINTVGLQQSVIDSINLCKFKKNEGLIEGTECSVCLSEFEEDETLRLLPKCSHAFHVPCIDTWLRSHKNCPLCRAPIVNESFNDDDDVNSNDLRSDEDTRVENLDNHGEFGLGSDRLEEGGVSEVRSRAENFDESPNENLKKNMAYFDGTSSNSTNNLCLSEQEVHQVRRSVSLDSSTASVIYRAMANVEGCEMKNTNIRGILAKSGSCTSRTSSSESSSVYKFMKKSFSTNGKPKHKRNQTSILPF